MVEVDISGVVSKSHSHLGLRERRSNACCRPQDMMGRIDLHKDGTTENSCGGPCVSSSAAVPENAWRASFCLGVSMF